MKVFLKTVLAIGLVASSSLALAERKYAFRQPLQGVDANPTFGMTTTEKQAYQENLANIEMCASESVQIIQEERVEIVEFEGPVKERKLVGPVYDERYMKAYRSDGMINTYGSNTYSQFYDFSTYGHEVNTNGAQQIKINSGHILGRRSPFVDGSRYVIKAVIGTDMIPENETATSHPVELWEDYKEIEQKENIYLVDVEHKTENYDWCVNNGYQTAN